MLDRSTYRPVSTRHTGSTSYSSMSAPAGEARSAAWGGLVPQSHCGLSGSALIASLPGRCAMLPADAPAAAAAAIPTLTAMNSSADFDTQRAHTAKLVHELRKIPSVAVQAT